MHSVRFFIVLTIITVGLVARAAVQPIELRCDSAVAPLGIDSPAPRLSWQMRSDEPGQRQTAYRILAASSLNLLNLDRADLCDTGKIASSASIAIAWSGKPLNSSQQVFWKVRLWDRNDRATDWSADATWTMGLLSEKDWLNAQWITDPALLAWVRPALGYRSEDAAKPETPKWIKIDLGAAYPLETVQLYALQHKVTERLGFPVCFKIEVANNAEMNGATTIADYTTTPATPPWSSTYEFKPSNVSARYLRITAPQLRTVGGVTCLAFSQIAVFSNGKNVAAHAAVTASDSIEKPPFSAAAVIDGLGLPGQNRRATDTLLLRREFPVQPHLSRALLHLSGQGSYELTINGQRVSDGLLSPGWTDTEKTCLYDTYDVTALLQPTQRNVVGLCLAGGMYNVQAVANRYAKFTTPFQALTVKGLLRLEYDGGLVETIPTDKLWSVATGPTTVSSMFGGEDYDARRAVQGWDQPGFNDRSWAAAVVNSHPPTGVLRGFSHSSPPFKLFETLSPISTKELKPGVTVYDLGQNAALMLDLKVRGQAGAAVKIVPAELVNENGSVDRSSSGGGEASWNYTLAGSPGGEEWHPRFFYHGSRYLEVVCQGPEGSPEARPVIVAISARVAHSDSPAAGEFSCSNDLFNRIRTLVRWAQCSNLAHVISDCPHRERLGWLEQYHLNGPALRYEFDLTRLYSKCFDDMLEAQTPAGLMPSIAPEYVIFDGGFRDSPEWGSALILAGWQHYLWTGDDSILRRAYPGMRRYIAYLDTKAIDGLLTFGLGDWFDLGPNPPGKSQLTPVGLSATAFYYLSTSTLARIARQIGQEADAAVYEQKALVIAKDFNKAFFNPGTGVYATGSQTAQALPLVLDLVPTHKRPATLAALIRDIENRDYALTAGDVGYRYLLRALADAGRNDVIFRINSQSEKPGYGYQLAHGCTSLSEAWNADRRASQCHFMLGQITEWLYGDLAGLAPDPLKPGFKNIIVQPHPTGDVTWAKARHASPYGPIVVNWRIQDGRFILMVEVPANSTATVHVPGRNAQFVETPETPSAPWVKELSHSGIESVYEVASGRYRFMADW